MTKKRSLAGNVALVVNAVSIILVYVAFFSTNWIESDQRITGAQLERFGLWTHCFRSFPNPNDVDDQTIFVGCHWIFDPFTSRYNEMKSFLLPPFIVVTQVFYSITFLGTSLTTIVSLWFFFSSTPEDRGRIQLTFLLGTTLIVFGVCATISVFTFALFANEEGWMPGHDNNYFGWTFGIAIASCFTLLGSGAFYLVETNIQVSKKKRMRDSQIKFNLETEM